ncbi:sulfate transporter [Lampropedia cohaerens]|uniref:Sulfate transporter n=1 Tax=Lampropedia cohaerens TaxID=1610491 RepID=A0A0U1PWK5_9BURK|nr:SulP family inorganic anion transporter [Lampropedia cohaerens]KKW66871.1 sulfate transporter [Lampropedia cohaerens]
MIALVESYRAGLWARQHWLPNIIAGVIVGVVALPLAMAFAIASGAKPEQGIYTSIVAGIAVSVFGGSRLQIAGPTGAFIVILADIVARYGIDGLQIATLMAGVILLLLGVSRTGAIIKFIPAPVIVGFTAGIGIIIWVGQWSYFFGLPEVPGGHFHHKLWAQLQMLPRLDLPTTLLGLLSLALIIGTPRVHALRRVPGPLVALVLVTLLQSIFGFSSVATIGSTYGEIPRGLPPLQLPEVTLSRLVELIGPAFAIAMLGAIESLLSAVVADRMADTRHNSSQELIGQGIANIAAPLFGGFAATGAIARTATNVRNGGTSPLAGIVHALTLVLIIVALAPLASNIPLTTLAAVLFVVAWNMSDVPHLLRMVRRAPPADIFILVVTLLLTVFADLVVAVNIGVVLAMLHFLKRMTDSVRVHREAPAALEQPGTAEALQGVYVYRVEGPFFFGAADSIEQSLHATDADVRVLVIRLAQVPFIDATGLQALGDTIAWAQRRGIAVLLAEPQRNVLRKMLRMGLIERLGRSNVHGSLAAALRHAGRLATMATSDKRAS